MRVKFTIDCFVLHKATQWFEEGEPDRMKASLAKMWEDQCQPTVDEVERVMGGGASLLEAYVGLFKNAPNLIAEQLAQSYELACSPDSGWVFHAWAWVRNYIVFRYRCHAVRPDCLANKTLANEVMDLHYLALLARADGIATRETRPMKMAEIAKAFFPNSLVVT